MDFVNSGPFADRLDRLLVEPLKDASLPQRESTSIVFWS